MKLINCKWNVCEQKHEHTWLSDNGNDIPANFDPDCASGSVILVISTGESYMKNTQGNWQKIGSTEVVK